MQEQFKKPIDKIRREIGLHKNAPLDVCCLTPIL